MTTFVQARNTLVGYLDPAFRSANPSIPIYYENTEAVDLDGVGDVVVRVAIDFVDHLRLDIDPTPHCEAFGEVMLLVLAKEGTGTASALALHDYLNTLLAHKELSGVTTKTPIPGKKSSKDGWLVMELVVPFSFYTA